jgi:hypothetical protein
MMTNPSFISRLHSNVSPLVRLNCLTLLRRAVILSDFLFVIAGVSLDDAAMPPAERARNTLRERVCSLEGRRTPINCAVCGETATQLSFKGRAWVVNVLNTQAVYL